MSRHSSCKKIVVSTAAGKYVKTKYSFGSVVITYLLAVLVHRTAHIGCLIFVVSFNRRFAGVILLLLYDQVGIAGIFLQSLLEIDNAPLRPIVLHCVQFQLVLE